MASGVFANRLPDTDFCTYLASRESIAKRASARSVCGRSKVQTFASGPAFAARFNVERPSKVPPEEAFGLALRNRGDQHDQFFESHISISALEGVKTQ